MKPRTLALTGLAAICLGIGTNSYMQYSSRANAPLHLQATALRNERVDLASKSYSMIDAETYQSDHARWKTLGEQLVKLQSTKEYDDEQNRLDEADKKSIAAGILTGLGTFAGLVGLLYRR